MDLASLIPANIEVEATNASVRFSSNRYNDNGDVAKANGSVRGDNTNCQPYSVVNMSNIGELLATSAAAYAHKVSRIFLLNINICVCMYKVLCLDMMNIQPKYIFSSRIYCHNANLMEPRRRRWQINKME